MFSLTVIDHVRMDSEHVARNYTIHAHAAERLANLVFAARIVIAALLAVATAAAITNLLYQARPYQIAAIVASASSLIAFALYSVLGLESRVQAHRSFAHRLWLASERYRAFMTEITEGLVDPAVLLRRRDDLINELHAIYEHGFAVDQAGYENARLSSVTSERAA